MGLHSSSSPRRDRVFRGCDWGLQSSGRVWVVIVMIQKAEDVGDQGCDAAKLPGRMALRVISPKKRSTNGQEEEVGMKWI